MVSSKVDQYVFKQKSPLDQTHPKGKNSQFFKTCRRIVNPHVAGQRFSPFLLLHCHTFGQISRLIYVVAAKDGSVVREELQENDG